MSRLPTGCPSKLKRGAEEGSLRRPLRPRGGALLSAVMCAAFAGPPCSGFGTALGDEYDESTEALKSRLLSEYPVHATRLEAALENIHCTFSASTMRTQAAKVTRGAFTGDFYVKGDSRQVIRVFGTDDAHFSGQAEVFCITPLQIFQLRQPTQGAPQIIEKFDDTGDKETREAFGAMAILRIDQILYATARTSNVRLTTLLEQGTIESIRKVVRDATTYLEVAFRFEQHQFAYKRCSVLLEPKMEYAIREYETEFWPAPGAEPSAALHRKGTVECQRMANGFVVPTRVLEDGWVDYVEGRFSNRWEYDIQVESLGDVADSQFTLAAFDLPEITLRPARRWYPFDRWYFWSLLATSVFGWLYLRKKSHAQRMGQTGQ